MAQHKSSTKNSVAVSANLRGLSVGALIVGIIAVLTCWVPVWGFLSGAAALTLGIIGLVKRAPRRTMSLAGVILGAAAIFLTFVFFLLLVIFDISSGANSNNPSSYSTNGTGGYQTDPFATN